MFCSGFSSGGIHRVSVFASLIDRPNRLLFVSILLNSECETSWLSDSSQKSGITYKVATITYRTQNFQQPSYSLDPLISYLPFRTLYSSSSNLLIVLNYYRIFSTHNLEQLVLIQTLCCSLQNDSTANYKVVECFIQ